MNWTKASAAAEILFDFTFSNARKQLVPAQNGILDDATWRSYRGSIPAILSTPRTRVWWHNFGVERLFDAEFIAAVDDLIADAPLFERSRHIAVFD